MIKKDYKDVDLKPAILSDDTKVEDVYIRWLIDKNDGAKNFALRRIEVKPGVNIPLHFHPEDHEIYILEGKGKFYNDTGLEEIVNEGNVLYIPPNEKHGINNIGQKDLIFLCIIPYLKKK